MSSVHCKQQRRQDEALLTQVCAYLLLSDSPAHNAHIHFMFSYPYFELGNLGKSKVYLLQQVLKCPVSLD